MYVNQMVLWPVHIAHQIHILDLKGCNLVASTLNASQKNCVLMQISSGPLQVGGLSPIWWANKGDLMSSRP